MSNQMTNYNERLEEILDEAKGTCTYECGNFCSHPLANRKTVKQAITSLIKELVAEAKPELKEKTASTEFTTWDRKTKVVKTFESETDPGFNKAINEFEQNLLKALEEK